MKKALVYHRIKPNFLEEKMIDMKDFELVAAIDYNKDGAKTQDVLETAHMLTNTIDGSWTNNEKIWVLKEDARSTSVGDVIVINREHHQVLNFGFRSFNLSDVLNDIRFPVHIKTGHLQKFTQVFDYCPKMSLANRYQFMQNFGRIKEWVDSYKNSLKLIGHDLEFNFGPIDMSSGSQHQCYFCLIDKGLQYDACKINFHGNNLSQVLLNGAIVYDERNGTISTHT